MNLFQRIVSLLLFALAAVPVIAQEAPPLDFLIERTEVRGARFGSPAVVEKESLLTEGRRYSETDLKDAMRRINRLPFVLDSSFALERGTERGAYSLVITIVETKPLFVEAFGTAYASRHRGSQSNSWTHEGLRAGLRGFLGSSTLLHVAADNNETYEAGVTQYNLFGRPGYVSLAVSWADDPSPFVSTTPDGEEYEIRFETGELYRLQVGIPVRGNHSIFARALTSESTTTFTFSTHGRQESISKNQLSEIAWHYDTTDDPILPAAGTIWRTGAVFKEAKATFTVPHGDALPERTLFETGFDQNFYFTSASHYRPISDFVSVSYGGDISVVTEDLGPIDIEGSERSEIAPHAGITTSLWSDRLTRRFGDFRFESNLVLHFNGHGTSFDDLAYRYLTFESSIVQRNVWGMLRLTFRYDDSETF
ncbi:MAG: hypothetical protein KY432_00715 [Acidobacteria bacterium]|nr:hypothetical protein [Acidobacteriota bacterium]